MSNLIVGAFVLVVFGHYFLPLCPKSNSFLPKTSYEQARNQRYFGLSDLLQPLFSVRDAHFIALFCPEFVTYINDDSKIEIGYHTVYLVNLGPW